MDPLWYRDAVVYELHVRSFFDANGDGYGDFHGLRAKLPYLKELGVNTLWLLPFYESPLKDDGYDIADYTKILPVHGDVEDFRSFLDEAHAAGMRVITELVLNHTSDRHPWFQEARRPGDPRRDWYVWSDSPDRYADARVIFRDFEPSNWRWDPVAGAYYWHRFYSHQPDLNWDNPEVERALHEVMFYWLDMGVDGLRLDAVPYLYEREGTSCENLPETLAAVKRLRRAVDERYGAGKVLLAEANQWPEDTIPYFGEGDGVQMAFNFPLMPRLYMALRREDRHPITEMLHLTSAIPENAQWALFLRNHDELTLEMVTDEERDYLYGEYASDPNYRLNLGIRRRLSPLLGGDRRRFELLNALLLTLPGTPVLYYGDEIGMGDNPFLGDRNGVRTPMQWSADRNAGFSRAPFQRLFLPPIAEGRYSYEFVNVEEALVDPHSRLQFVRRLLGIRNAYPKVFGRGSLEVLPVENRSILAFLRRYEDATVLVATNLSRYLQAFSLPLGAWSGHVPLELFSQAPFPAVGSAAYPLVLGPHGFALFLLQPEVAPAPTSGEPADAAALPVLRLSGGLETVLVDTLVQGTARERLEKLLPEHIQRVSRLAVRPEGVVLDDAVRLRTDPPLYLCRFRTEPGAATVFLPLSVRDREGPGDLARIRGPSGEGILYDAAEDPALYPLVIALIRDGWQGRSLEALFRGRPLAPLPAAAPEPHVLQPGRAVARGFWVHLALRADGALTRTAEQLPRLAERGMPGVAGVLGALEMRRGPASETLALVGSLPAGEPMGASAMLAERIRRTLDRVTGPAPDPDDGLLEEVASEALEVSRQLGVRLARLHLALPAEPMEEDALAQRMARLSDRVTRVDSRTVGLSASEIERAIRRIEAQGGVRWDWKPVGIHGGGLDAFLTLEGELILIGLGPRGTGIAAEDLALLGCDLEGICQQVAGGPDSPERGWADALAGALWRALLGAYQGAMTDTATLAPPRLNEELLFAFTLECVLDHLDRGGERLTGALRRRPRIPAGNRGSPARGA